MTPDQRALLDRINTEVNALPYEAIATQPEPPDYYTDTPQVGHSWECRDYVQRKGTLLKAAGWPDPVNLVELLCYVETGEHHGVLQLFDPAMPPPAALIYDSRCPDIYVLDSRFPTIYQRSAPPPGYRWDAVQVAGTMPIQWEKLT